MSIILSRDIVLSDSSLADPNAPHIGWHTIAQRGSITADYAEAFYPIENVTDFATHTFWRSVSLNTQYIYISAGLNAGCDYVGFANHNFGSGQIAYLMQGSVDGETWEDIGEEIIPEDDSPHVQVFNVSTHAYYRIKLTPTGTQFPRISILFVGKMLIMQRKLYVGHTPITMGRQTNVSNNRSETGQFLGRVIKSEFLQTSASFKTLSPAWVRTYFEPFAEFSRDHPFFWVWRPVDYPKEVGFVWLTDDIKTSNMRANGMMGTSISMQGIGRFVARASGDTIEFSSSVDSA